MGYKKAFQKIAVHKNLCIKTSTPKKLFGERVLKTWKLILLELKPLYIQFIVKT